MQNWCSGWLVARMKLPSNMAALGIELSFRGFLRTLTPGLRLQVNRYLQYFDYHSSNIRIIMMLLTSYKVNVVRNITMNNTFISELGLLVKMVLHR